jgi:uncharacterized protein YciI
MTYVVHCLDKPGATKLRLSKYGDHKAYLSSSSIKTVISGPLLDDDGETMIGSLFIVEAPTKADVEAFNREDPFAKAGVWERISIHPFNMRVDNRA